MKKGEAQFVCLMALAIVGLLCFSIGLNVTELALEAIDEWYPKRTYTCWEHSGEFDELFALRDFAQGLMGVGAAILLMICGWVFVCMHNPLRTL